MKKVFSALFVVFCVSGCSADLDSVMGRKVEGTATTEPRKIHCDLIFPGGGESDRR